MGATEATNGIISGCAVSAQGPATMNLDAGAGSILIADVVKGVASATLTIGAADGLLPRWDNIEIDNTGTYVVTAGTPTAPDSFGLVPRPARDYAKVYRGGVFVDAAVTSIVASAIDSVSDVVTIVAEKPSDSMLYTFLATTLSNADPGSGNCGFNSTTFAGITAMYCNYLSPTVGGLNKPWFIPLSGSPGVLVPFYLRVWSRKNPAAYVVLAVTAVASHGAGAGTYAELTCSVTAASSATTGPGDLSTDPLDTVLEYAGAIPPIGWSLLKKTAVTSRNSTTVVAADPDLQFAMAANTNYIIRGFIRWDSPSAIPGFKFDFDGPAAPTRVVVAMWAGPSGGTPAFLATDNAFNVTHTSTPSGASPGVVRFEIIVENGSNAGTFSLRWAQNSSNFNNISVRPGSYMEYIVS